MTFLDGKEINEDRPFNCRHDETITIKGREKCTSCGCFYDEQLIDWVRENE